MTRSPRVGRVLTLTLVASLPLLSLALVALAQPGGNRTTKPATGGPAKPSGAGRAESDKPESGKADPAKPSEEYFVDWPKPKLAIVITGRQDGYIEPCGCAGLENQKGGLSRRDTFMAGLLEQGWDLLPIDVGGLVHRFGKQSEIKFGMSVDALKQMGYQAVGFGPDDLRLSATEIAAAVAAQDVDSSIFVAANVGLLGLTPPVKVIEAGGIKVGITSVLGETYQKEVNNPDIEFTPAVDGLKAVMPKLNDCDLRILLSHATMDETARLAVKFPEFDVIVVADGGDEPPNRPGKIKGSQAKLIEVGHKGMFAVVLGLYDAPQESMRYQRVALDARFAASPRMKQLMQSYQSQLELLGLDGLGLRPIPHPRASGHDSSWGEFAGVKSCKECHPTAYKIWKNSKHAEATQALVKADPPRIADPECISCHVTGWNPQEFFPYTTGFVSLASTPQLAGNTCENCHGPAAAHVAAENGKDSAKKEKLRAAVRVTKAQAEQNICIRCHDLDNSPNFSKTDAFDKVYWPKVEHKGKK
jgi:Cytochrome c554 and c-prime